MFLIGCRFGLVYIEGISMYRGRFARRTSHVTTAYIVQRAVTLCQVKFKEITMLVLGVEVKTHKTISSAKRYKAKRPSLDTSCRLGGEIFFGFVYKNRLVFLSLARPDNEITISYMQTIFFVTGMRVEILCFYLGLHALHLFEKVLGTSNFNDLLAQMTSVEKR